MPVLIEVPEVPGDPAGMRVLAGALQDDARAIEGVASGISSAVGQLTFEGPAAERFQQTTQSSGRDLSRSAARLDDVARLLRTKAEEVEVKQRQRLARIEQLRQEYADQGIPARVM